MAEPLALVGRHDGDRRRLVTGPLRIASRGLTGVFNGESKGMATSDSGSRASAPAVGLESPNWRTPERTVERLELMNEYRRLA